MAQIISRRSQSILVTALCSNLICQSTFCCASNKSPTYSEIPIADFSRAINDALLSIGYTSRDAKIIEETLMFAELRGNNQGVIKLTAGALNEDPLADGKEVECILDSPVSAKLDGHYKCGMVVVSDAVDIAIEKTKKSGVAIVGCSGYASATGALGLWSRKIAQAGFIGIVCSQTYEMVAPHGSYEPIFGTNPISIGIPTEPRIQVLDMATSAAAFYALKTAEKEGQSIADNIAYDSTGKMTTNPTEGLKGAIQVFDRNFKGSHLALMIELLAGALNGASMSDKMNNPNWGSLVVAIDPSILGSSERFKEKAQEMCMRVKNAKKLPDVTEIYLPGERGDEVEYENLKKGTIKISDKILKDLHRMASSRRDS